MPYIGPSRREEITIEIDFKKPVADVPPGELNYVLTFIVLEYLEKRGRSYTTMNEIVGVLEQVKDEFQRRAVHPYEDAKKAENGDVYP